MMEIDPVVKDAMLDKVFEKHGELKDLPDEQKKNARIILGMLMDQIVVQQERLRISTIDDVLRVFDVAAVTNDLKFIRRAIEKLKTIME